MHQNSPSIGNDAKLLLAFYFGSLVLSLGFITVLTDFQGGLPYCNELHALNQIVLVSTLDGKLTALDPNNGGTELWSVHPGHEPMLSSSIHRLELTNFGQLVRMIPSLNGGLYKFNGENVEPIPLTADHLLQASFRYSDDLVISGGRDSQTVGVSLETGEVLYECSMKGCTDEGRHAAGEVLLIQRTGQVVRAVEPRSGSERWNFSVAQHDLKLLSECHSEATLPRVHLKVVVPEGVIFAVNSGDSSVSWKHQFDSPVVNTWEIQKGKVYDIDIFSTSSHANDVSPSLYIGMHQKQLYIQESVRMLERRNELASEYGKNLITYETGDNRLPWRPVAANFKNAGLPEDNDNDSETSLEEIPTTALSVLYASPYVEGLGFYLYSKDAEKDHCNVTLQADEEAEDSSIESASPSGVSETPVTVVIVSLWYWWREVAIISFTTAIVVNFLFTRRYLRRQRESQDKASVSDKASSQTDSGIVVVEQVRPAESQAEEYESRYLSDFLPVHRLGKGGFGVVFEAKNKIDDCHYAIKRIVLPDAPESRERVMREVRALAKLDHHHIVRYFNSWLESPPPGWQHQHDVLFSGQIDDSLRDEIITETTTSCYPPVDSYGVSKSNHKRADSADFSLRFEERNDASDSFIVFAHDSQGSASSGQLTATQELSIAIDESKSVSDKRQRNGCDWGEHSSICLSPRKVYLYIQMQLCKKESLKDWLHGNLQRDFPTVMEIFEQIVKAVDYVHYHNLIHRDLKPSNIFFSMDQQIKVGDFGLVTTIVGDTLNAEEVADNIRKGHTSQVGTQLYMSPEQLSGKPYSYKVDIFSLGLILFELLVPFHTQMERLDLLQQVKKRKFPASFVKEHAAEYNLLQRMLSTDPDERPSTSEILAVPPLSQCSGDMYKGWGRQRRESSRTSVSSASSSDFPCDYRYEYKML